MHYAALVLQHEPRDGEPDPEVLDVDGSLPTREAGHARLMAMMDEWVAEHDEPAAYGVLLLVFGTSEHPEDTVSVLVEEARARRLSSWN